MMRVIVSNIHPFELYKIFVSLRTHFTSLKFQYNNNHIKLKYENFYKTKNYLHFEKLSHKWSKEFAEEVFISNFLHDYKTSIHTITSSTALAIHEQWAMRIRRIDSIFHSDLYKIFKSQGLKDTDGLKELLEQKREAKGVKKASLDTLHKVEFESTDHGFVGYLIHNISPETICILNKMYNELYCINFLKDWYTWKIEPRALILKTFKYRTFIDTQKVMKLPKIKEFKSLI